MARISFNVTADGKTKKVEVDTENWPRSLGPFLSRIANSFTSTPQLYVVGFKGTFSYLDQPLGEFEVVEVVGPFFNVGSTYSPDRSLKHINPVSIISCDQSGESTTYCLKGDGLYFNIKEQAVLEYLLKGTEMKSEL